MTDIGQFDPPPGGLELFVSTWHVAPLLGGRPEGLPTDLLSRHSALFYLVDRVVCDQSGLDGELKWDNYWLSATIFGWLKEDGLLRVVDLASPPYVSPSFWQNLGGLEEVRAVHDRVKHLAETIRRGDPGAVRETVREIDPSLLKLNRSIFYNLRTPDNWLPYYQTDGNLGATASRRPDLFQLPGLSRDLAQWRALRLARLISLVEDHLPDPELLPPLPTPPLKAALTRNTNREKARLFRVIYGEEPHENFRDFRRNERGFVSDDARVDFDDRRRQARANYERLLSIREQTRDLRWDLQTLVLRIVDGEISLKEACAGIAQQVRTLQEYISSQWPKPVRVANFLVLELVAGLVEFFLLGRWTHYPQMFGMGPAFLVPPLIESAEMRYIDPVVRWRRTARGRDLQPIGSLYTDLYKFLGKDMKADGVV